MSGIATAVIGGAVISSVVGAKGAKDASQAQSESSSAAIDEQRRQFDETTKRLDEAQQFAREQQQPFQAAGTNALRSQQALIGELGIGAQRKAFDRLESSPGQQFLQDRAQKNLLRSSAAIGGLGGGNVREALVQQGVGFAQQDLQNQFGRLGQLAGQGQASAANIGQGAIGSAGQFGQLGAQSSGNIQNALLASGNARASGIIGQNNAIQSGLSGVFTGLGQSGLFSSGGEQAILANNTNPFARTV